MAKKRIWILSAITALIVAVGIVLFILWKQHQTSKKTDGESLHVVILDSEEFYYSESGIGQGIRFAMEDIEKNGSFPITFDLIEDDGNYVKGLSLAKALAKDPSVDIVITLQNFDSVDAEMPLFEEAEKPFIVTMGCYDEVAEQGYNYLLTDFLNARTMGEQIGHFLVENGSRNIALCHSDTTFERDQIRGVLSVLENEPDCNVYYSQTGPFRDTELGDMLAQYKLLDIDTVVANFYAQEDSEWLLTRLSKTMPELVRVGDYVLDNSGVLKEYGKDLEGVFIVPNYPYENSRALDDFIARYENETKENFTTTAIQYYDLFRMLSDYCGGKKPKGSELMEKLKQPSGYAGTGGTLSYDENGCLQVEDCPVFLCHNAEFVMYGEEEE